MTDFTARSSDDDFVDAILAQCQKGREILDSVMIGHYRAEDALDGLVGSTSDNRFALLLKEGGRTFSEYVLNIVKREQHVPCLFLAFSANREFRAIAALDVPEPRMASHLRNQLGISPGVARELARRISEQPEEVKYLHYQDIADLDLRNEVSFDAVSNLVEAWGPRRPINEESEINSRKERDVDLGKNEEYQKKSKLKIVLTKRKMSIAAMLAGILFLLVSIISTIVIYWNHTINEGSLLSAFVLMSIGFSLMLLASSTKENNAH
ncbi:MAG: hypothetical protein AAGB13_07415 [Cyanobacteria bacterium P01_F01_bin.33]